MVQVPWRNGMATAKTVNAARIFLCGVGRFHVSPDEVIKTMKETGRLDMIVKHKETARGGLAVNIIER